MKRRVQPERFYREPPVAAKEEMRKGWSSFITAIINFLIMAVVIFIFVKIVNSVISFGKKKPADEPVTTKVCPYCCTEIDINATKCPHCTSELIEIEPETLESGEPDVI